MTSPLCSAYLIALDGMKRNGPRDLNRKASIEAEDLYPVPDISDAALIGHLKSATPNDELHMQLGLILRQWDSAPGDARWALGTEPNTRQRRELITKKLSVGDDIAEFFDQAFPHSERDGTVVIADSWDPWYSVEVRQARSFYWEHYQDYLLAKGKWSGDAISKLDRATTHVVERLNDPTRQDPNQVKGLVVGYVQSGKTANFTGVIAKSIDAGYRLIIVLTGVTDLLRQQTQRRLDMELVGVENILGGVDPDNAESLIGMDYQGDAEWIEGNFVSHGCRPSDAGLPNIHRMTSYDFDYQSLKTGINALDFVPRDRSKPLFYPENLFSADARLVVVKKNGAVLQKLVRDLKSISAKLHQIPALIIDDESDQASINTGKSKRTRINDLISQLLSNLPRGQYVGYTATPFANVFIDPTDAYDIFPSNFLISLEPPPGYMGAEDFHDIDSSIPPEDRNFSNSKERAHIRLLKDRDDSSELLRAMDTFVLAGVIKAFRSERGVGTFRHHTMLVHEAMRTSAHSSKADAIRQVWNRAKYLTSGSHARLRKLYNEDILPVSRAMSPELPVPASFDEVIPYLGDVVRKISPGNNPILIVNSDTEIEQEQLNFVQHDVWRILVGGNKLSRGFTVEGLTVSYYRRNVKHADALMQMGRWFGFRSGYRDLVRLFVTKDLRDSFESICRDEDDFRAEIRQYAEMGSDGRPLVTPRDIAPLVSSRKLAPTAAAKMYHAVLVERKLPNREPSSGYPSLSNQRALDNNIDACVPLLAAARSLESFGKFDARVGRVDHAEMVAALTGIEWASEDTFRPDLAWLRSLGDRVSGWNIVLPQQKSGRRATFRGEGPFSLHGRAVSNGSLRGNSTSAHREALQSGKSADSRSGWLLLYPVVARAEPGDTVYEGIETDPAGVVMALRLELPSSASPQGQRPLTYRATGGGSRPTYSPDEG